MSSPWIYAAIFGIAAIDAFFPAVPSETLVITAGVFAASDPEPSLILVALVAACGAFVGDHISYGIGKFAGSRLVENAPDGSKRAAAFRWARGTLEERGGLVLLIARYIPGGRTAATLTMGALHWRLRSFSFFDALAAASWGIYCVLLGYIGGAAFEDDPIKALGLGLGIALAVTAIVEVVRHQRKKKASGSNTEPDKAPAAEG